MNRSAFKKSITWQNIGEVAVITGILNPSVSYCAHFGPVTARQCVHLSRFSGHFVR